MWFRWPWKRKTQKQAQKTAQAAGQPYNCWTIRNLDYIQEIPNEKGGVGGVKTSVDTQAPTKSDPPKKP